MRKEDRVAASKQQSGQQHQPNTTQPEPREQEQLRGSGSTGQPSKPQRQGKLPLPD